MVDDDPKLMAETGEMRVSNTARDLDAGAAWQDRWRRESSQSLMRPDLECGVSMRSPCSKRQLERE